MSSASAIESPFAISEAYEINGFHTEIVLHKFINRYLLIITQYEKLNNIFTAFNDVSVTGTMKNQSLDIKQQFGMANDEIECGIRFLLSNIQTPRLKNDVEVVICLGLRQYNGKVLKQLADVLNQLGWFAV